MFASLLPILALGLASASAFPLSSTYTRRAANVRLFPVSQGTSSWSVSRAAADALPLSDATFRPEKDITELSHNYVDAPDGVQSMQAHYPAGSYKPSASPRGGISFYAPGPADVDLTTAKEATLSYSVLFPSGFEFVKGGKLPGLCEWLRFPRVRRARR